MIESVWIIKRYSKGLTMFLTGDGKWNSDLMKARRFANRNDASSHLLSIKTKPEQILGVAQAYFEVP